MLFASILCFAILSLSHGQFAPQRLSNRTIFRDAVDVEIQSTCPLQIDVAWTSKLEGAVYSHAVIDSLLSHDGSKQVVVTTYNGRVELLNHDGYKPYGWPVLFDGKFFQASPVVFHGGILAPDLNGNVVLMRLNKLGLYEHDYELLVPPLKVRLNWFENLDLEHDTVGDLIFSSVPSDPEKGARGEKSVVGLSSPPKAKEGAVSSEDEAWDEIYDWEKQASVGEGGAEWDNAVEMAADLPVEAKESWKELFGTESGVPSPSKTKKSVLMDDEFIFVDPHILAAPTVTDVDHDGNLEILLAVSFFFDPRMYATEEDVDLSNYVAGAVMCYDMSERQWRWSVHLDLSTSSSSERALLFNSPTSVDLEGDGKNEVIIGTSLGFVYVLDGATGATRPGFPIQIGEIEGQIAAADLTGNGIMDLIVTDANGNVLVLDASGKTVWHRRLGSHISTGASVGDINGDGTIDVVIASTMGHIWAFDGPSGRTLPHFPIRAGGKVLAPITLLSLAGAYDGQDTVLSFEEEEEEDDEDDDAMPGQLSYLLGAGLALVFPSFDGHVYIIDGSTGCVNKVDVGEQSYSMVLADDITDDGRLDLLVTTLQGTVLCLSTSQPFSPLNTWSSRTQDGGVFEAGARHGIQFSERSRSVLSTLGDSIDVSVEIVDTRPPAMEYGAPLGRHYNVSFFLIASEHEAPAAPASHRALFPLAGSTSLWLLGEETVFPKDIREPISRSLALPREMKGPLTLHVRMENEHGQVFRDEFTVLHNVYRERAVKYLVLIPFTVVCGYWIMGGRAESSPL